MDTDEPTDGGGPRHGRYVAQHRRVAARRSGARRALIVANVLVALSLVVGVLGVIYAEVQLHRVGHVTLPNLVPPGRTRQSPKPPSGGGPPITVLIVGSDTRAGLNQAGDSAYGSATNVGGARSDTIMLARVVPATRQIELLSIPRDLYVPVPGMGHQKINAAFNSGPNLLVQVIEQQLGIEVNHYVDVDFDTFKDIADAVGGVQVYFPTAARDLYSDLGVGTPGQVPGCVNLTGNQALAYVRSREYQYWQDGEWKQEAQSDLARIQRQQTFIRKLIKRAEGAGLTSPVELNQIISAITTNLTVDDQLSTQAMLSLARDFANVDADRIPGMTLATNAETLSDGEEVLLPDTSQDQAQIAQFLAFGTASAGTPSGGSGATTTSPTTTTGTGTTTTTTPTASTVAPSTVSLEVANGTRVADQAATTARQLRSVGFEVSSTFDAPSEDTGPTEILYGADAIDAAQTVAAYVSGPVSLKESDQVGSESVELVTGSGFAGISSTPSSSASASSASASSGSASSSTSTTAVPSSTTSTTTYVLPGTPAGQVPPTCGD